MRYRFRRKTLDRAKRAKWSIILGTFLTLFVAGIVTLVTCAYTYHWTWEMVAHWMNPFSEGNNWAWLVYAGIIGFVFLLVWLIHNARVERILNDER